MEIMILMGAFRHERLPPVPSNLTKYLLRKESMMGQLWQQYASFQLSGGNIADIVHGELKNQKVSYVRFSHHLAHAATACFTSPFEEAACMIVDGQGEWGAITYFEYRDGKIHELHRVKGEESLGILYQICTAMCGFDPEK